MRTQPDKDSVAFKVGQVIGMVIIGAIAFIALVLVYKALKYVIGL